LIREGLGALGSSLVQLLLIFKCLNNSLSLGEETFFPFWAIAGLTKFLQVEEWISDSEEVWQR
jgi:hypothetical protein